MDRENQKFTIKVIAILKNLKKSHPRGSPKLPSLPTIGNLNMLEEDSYLTIEIRKQEP